MSSPIHDHYRCVNASSRRSQANLSVQESEKKARMMEKSPEEAGSTGGLLDTLQPEPLVAAMYSLQFVADVVNRVQSALHQCTTSQKPTNSSMTGIEFASSSEPSFCYFFIDMQPQYATEFESSCHDPDLDTDLKNISDKQSTNNNSPVKTFACNMQRQRSISECSDDSFICFEDDSNSVDCTTFEHVDFDSTDNTDDCKFDDSQEHRKRVRFNLKPEIHVMHTWDFAYRAARKGGWQELARDRDRFQQRIKRVAPTINTILNSNHRDKIYKDRFLDVN
ncbi:hypothetical protein ACLKA6_007603 [Drosophila palustris]